MEKTKRIYPHRPYVGIANLNKISDEQKNKVKELYLQGASQSSIEKTLKMTRKTIRTILKENSIERDKSTQWRLSRNSSLNENVFNQLTPEALYWIGFLYADGHIRKDKEYSIELEIELKDLGHLNKYKDFFGCNKSIKTFDNSCKLKIYSKVLHQKLKDLGFTHNKSYTAKPHDLLKESRDFWRGVVDGDGSLSNQLKAPLLHLCGTVDTIEEFISFIKRQGVETIALPRYCKGSTCLYQVNFSCIKAIDITNILYKDAEVYLDRKYEKYQSYLNTN